MKSFQVQAICGDRAEEFSDLQVLKSAAGWYLGTIHTDPTIGMVEPGSRDTDYYKTEEDAKFALTVLEYLNRRGWVPEDTIRHWEGIMHAVELDRRGVGYRWTP